MAAPAPDAPTRRVLREFSRSLPMLLLQAHQSVMTEFRPLLRAHGITEQQWRVLRAIRDTTDLRLGALASATLISAPSLTRIVRALEQRGLVKRRVERADNRAASVRITAAGTRFIDLVAPDSEACYRAIARRFGADDLESLYALLTRLPQQLARRRGASADAART